MASMVHPMLRLPRPSPAPAPPLPARASLFLGALLALASCSSTGKDKPEPELWTPPEMQDEFSLGYAVAVLGQHLQAWSNLKHEARREKHYVEIGALEQALRQRTNERFDDLLVELASGPKVNRSILAIALGFSGREEALSPLLMALNDAEPDVVGNALLGLGQLASPDTPLSEICYLLREDPDPLTRNNAAFAIQRIVASGGGDPCALQSCRDALNDPEGGVRAQAAVTLGLLDDAESIEPLSTLLYDEFGMVCAASAHALASLALAHPPHKGTAVRALVEALERSPADRKRQLRRELVKVHGVDLGDKIEEWKEWAYNMP